MRRQLTATTPVLARSVGFADRARRSTIRHSFSIPAAAQYPSNREVPGGISRVLPASSFPNVPAYVLPFVLPCVLLSDGACVLSRREILPSHQTESGREAAIQAPARR